MSQQTATAAVVDNKLVPITGASDSQTVVITAQGMTHRFQEYQGAGLSRVAVLVNAVFDGRHADPKAFALATGGMVEGTRSTIEGKRTDGPNTADARKFQAYVRQIWGAVRLGRLEMEGFSSNEVLVSAARMALAGKSSDGSLVPEWAPCDWQGTTDADKALDSVKKATSKAVKAAAEDEGIDDIMSISADQFAALKGKASKKLQEAAAVAKLASMEKRAAKIVDDLIASYGFDDAEAVLKSALELLPARMMQVA
jgi:hypothetical protein